MSAGRHNRRLDVRRWSYDNRGFLYGLTRIKASANTNVCVCVSVFVCLIERGVERSTKFNALSRIYEVNWDEIKKNVQIAFKIKIKYFSVTCCVMCLHDQKKITTKMSTNTETVKWINIFWCINTSFLNILFRFRFFEIGLWFLLKAN